MYEKIDDPKVNQKKIKEIEFRYSNNFLLNSGIIALEHYLEEFKEKTDISYEFKLMEKSLLLNSNELSRLLEEVYYFMGKEMYDTSGESAKKKADKFYFKKEPFQAIKFAKMKNYGLAELITNDATSTASEKGRKMKFDKLIHEDKEFAIKIAHYLEANKKKLKYFSFVNGELKYNLDDKGEKFVNRGGESEIFIDAPYTKTTKLELEEGYLEKGDQVCYLTGEAYKKLLDVQNTSPFLSGILNFNSHFTARDKNISWKVMYVSRFSPKLGFYSYSGQKDSKGLAVYFFISDNLLNLKRLFRQNRSIYKNKTELVKENYSANFDLYNWEKWCQVNYFFLGPLWLIFLVQKKIIHLSPVLSDAKYLLCILNSRLMDYLYRCEFPSWGNPWHGGRIQFRGDRMETIPIVVNTKNKRSEIETIVNDILTLKKNNPEADVFDLEAEIDRMVYQLYGLTPEEIAIVEGES